MAARTSNKKGSNKNNGKKKVSGRRGTPTRQENQTDIAGIIGIVLFCLGILLFTCNFIPSRGGFLNGCRTFLRGMGGSLCLLIPLMCCFYGVVLVFFRNSIVSTRRMICGIILFLLIETIFQIFVVKRIGAGNYGQFLQLSYEDSSRSMQGGGLIGALLAWPLYKALDVWGAVIVLLFSTIIVLVIMTGFTFGDFGPAVSEWVDDLRENRQLRREEKEALREEKEEELLNREVEEARERAQKKKKPEPEKFSEENLVRSEPKKEEEKKPDTGEAGNTLRPSGKKKKKNTAVKAVEPNPEPAKPAYPSDEPITGSFRPVPGAKPKKHVPYNGANVRQYNKDLYIEREDEFTRKPGEPEDRNENNGRGFTEEEAVYAFYHGPNSNMPESSPYARPQEAPNNGPSLGNPIVVLHPEKARVEEEDPYEAYRTKNYDTGVAVGYDPDDTAAPELEDIGVQNEDSAPTESVPSAAVTAERPAAEPVSTQAASPFARPAPVSPEASGTAGRPVPPVEPVMPKMPTPPVPPVPPYERNMQAETAQAAASVFSAQPIPTTAQTAANVSAQPVAPTAQAAASVFSAQPVAPTAQAAAGVISAQPVVPAAQTAASTQRQEDSRGKRTRRRRGGNEPVFTPAPAAVVSAGAAVSGLSAMAAQAVTSAAPAIADLSDMAAPAAMPAASAGSLSAGQSPAIAPSAPADTKDLPEMMPDVKPAPAQTERPAPPSFAASPAGPAQDYSSGKSSASAVPAAVRNLPDTNEQTDNSSAGTFTRKDFSDRTSFNEVPAPQAVERTVTASERPSAASAAPVTQGMFSVRSASTAPASVAGGASSVPAPKAAPVPASANTGEELLEHREHPSGTLPASVPASGYVSRPQERPARAANSPESISIPFVETNVNAVRGPAVAQPVELRQGRLDGTPLVPLPRDMHDSQVQPVQKEEYIRPSLDLLVQSRTEEDPDQRAKDENGMKKLLATLESFGVQARGLTYTHGPAITRYEIQPAPGVKVSRIVNLVDDIALNMASTGVRIEAPIPGKAAVGIEVPNESISMVTLRDVLDTPEMEKETSPTAVALGKGISGKPVIADMAKMPHVLIAGATGSGKSVCINTIINSIIYRASPDEVRLILVDPKVVELSVYNGIPHLLIPVVTDPKKASAALDWAVVEMEHRYKRFESMGVRDIRGYNAAIGPDEPKMYKIIVIIDELADLMMVAPGEVEESICRLAQLARAAGIHLVIATQRPSVNVITGVIKANIPSRIAFAVSSQIDSRTILDSSGAEKLLGKGDMLYAPQGANKPTRVQGCFVSDAEVERIVSAVKSQHQAEYSEDVLEKINSATEAEKAQKETDSSAGQESQVDEMLAKAIELAIDSGQVSISMLQRRLRIGYARAGRLVDEMTLRGITAESEGNAKPRQVLITREEWNRMKEEEGL